MKLKKALLDELMVRPRGPADLDKRSTEATTIEWKGSDIKNHKKVAEDDLASFVEELSVAQRLLWASNTHALLIVLQAMDAAGKDGTIRHVMSGVNPQGCKVEAFKQPTGEELAHDFLWRASKVLPRRGMIGIFNRSYYEEVLVVRVHPDCWPGDRPSRVTAPQRTYGVNATRTSMRSSTISTETGPGSSRSSCTFPETSRRDDSSSDSTTRPRTGSSRSTIWPNANIGRPT